MVNSKQRKIVTIVCIVLGVLLIAGGIIGTLLYLNGNEYRFRMNVFIGKYYSYNLVMSDRNTQYIKIYDSDNGNNKYNILQICSAGVVMSKKIKLFLTKRNLQ